MTGDDVWEFWEFDLDRDREHLREFRAATLAALSETSVTGVLALLARAERADWIDRLGPCKWRVWPEARAEAFAEWSGLDRADRLGVDYAEGAAIGMW